MIYFSSDHHFGHNNVIKYCSRPFKDVQEMNELMVLKWNEVVEPESIVYYLGDFSMSFNSAQYVKRLNGNTKYLIPGNHDLCHSYHKKARTEEKRSNQIRQYESLGWIVLKEQETLPLHGISTFNLCHHPYTKDEYHDPGKPDKYDKWRPKDDGRILLCGHIHEKWKTNRSDNGTLMINIGVDVWDFKPVSLDQILQLISECS